MRDLRDDPAGPFDLIDILRSIGGIAGLLVIARLPSINRKAIRPRVVVAALAMQVAICALIPFVPVGKAVLGAFATGVNHVLECGNEGLEFMFAGLVSPRMFDVFGRLGFVLALRGSPTS